MDATNTAVVNHSYDGFNRLISSVVGTTAITYTYNAQGIRTSRQVGDTYTQYLLDGGNVMGEVTDGTVTTYLRGANLISNGDSYYLYNAHGDVVQLTDSTGAVTTTYEYDAFGNENNPSDTDVNPFRYCGEYYDTETGLYYLRARYYDPTVGRFTQEDTHWNTANMIYGDNPQKINEREDALGLKTYSYAPQILSILQAGNLYVYCVDNPLFYIDPSGQHALGKLFNVRALPADSGAGGAIAGGGGGDVAIFWLVMQLFSSLDKLLTQSKIEAISIQYSNEVEEKGLTRVATISLPQNLTYVGIDLRGGVWKAITDPMDFESAYVWAQTQSFGRKTNWGLYTEDKISAWMMAFALGGPFPELDYNRIGEFPHYHVAGREFRNIYNSYKHFHVWFGELYLEGSQ